MILVYIGFIFSTTSAAIAPIADLLPPNSPDLTPTDADAKLRGLYVPDNLEKRYDDGSDKSPPAPVPLADSPYGPVPAGSGLEGQYVADNLEKRYDPGLYVADNIEKQFDDGLDRNVNPQPILVQTRLGLVEAGSGVEGQYVDDKIETQFDSGLYVDDHIEKRFDDGLFRGETSVGGGTSDGVPHGLVVAGVGSVPSK